jgi:hypothetical protein
VNSRELLWPTPKIGQFSVPFMIFTITYTTYEGPNYLPRILIVSRPLIANMISFVNISKFFKWKNIYIMTFGVAHWDTLDESLAFSMQEEDILEHTDVICEHFSQLVNRCVT